jgi:hypothetical protein
MLINRLLTGSVHFPRRSHIHHCPAMRSETILARRLAGKGRDDEEMRHDG